MNSRDEDNLVVKLKSENGNEYILRGDQRSLERAAGYAAKHRRVRIGGPLVGKTLLKVDRLQLLPVARKVIVVKKSSKRAKK